MNKSQNFSMPIIAAAISGGVIILGSLLAWETASLGLVTGSIGGMSGDGRITIICGFVVLFAALGFGQKHIGYYLIPAGLGACIAIATSLYDTINVAKLGQTNSMANVSPGVGLWLVLIGSFIGCLFLGKAILTFRRELDGDYDEEEDIQSTP